MLAGPEHDALRDELVAVIRKHSQEMSAAAVLAIVCNVVGHLAHFLGYPSQEVRDVISLNVYEGIVNAEKGKEEAWN